MLPVKTKEKISLKMMMILKTRTMKLKELKLPTVDFFRLKKRVKHLALLSVSRKGDLVSSLPVGELRRSSLGVLASLNSETSALLSSSSQSYSNQRSN